MQHHAVTTVFSRLRCHRANANGAREHVFLKCNNRAHLLGHFSELDTVVNRRVVKYFIKIQNYEN